MTKPAAAQSHCWASVPGKVIITGEYAVAFGQSAIGVAINRLSKATLSSQPVASNTEAMLTLQLPQLHKERTLSVHQAQQLADHVAQQHKAFLAGQIPLSSLFSDPEDLLLAALGYGISTNQLAVQQHLDFTLHSELLMGGGMGSSASTIAALLAALLHANHCQFDKHSLYQQVQVIEHWQHGRSSGLDPRLCVYGGMHFLQGGQYRQLDISIPPQWFLVSSGKPQSSTGECVELVRQQQHSESFWQQFGEVVKAMEGALLVADGDALVELIKANHRLLQTLSVVPKTVAEFIAQVELAGGAGKICGAGSIRGEAGGLILVAGVNIEPLEKLCQATGYQYWPLESNHQGVMYG
jgi:mevalonate kinase